MARETEINFEANAAVALGLFAAMAAAFLTFWPSVESPILHAILDTGICLTTGLLALLMWDASTRTRDTFSRLLAITLTVVGLFELLHMIFALEAFAGPNPGALELGWRTAGWAAPHHLFPVALMAALPLSRRGRSVVWPFTIGVVAVGVGLFALFVYLPLYTAPGLLGITRPTLLLAPLLWLGAFYVLWRIRTAHEFIRAIALMSLILVFANIPQLFSSASNDAPALIAHFGKLIARLYFLLSLIQVGAVDSVRRRHAEGALQLLNKDLERRVQERTAELSISNTRLSEELEFHKEAEERLRQKRERLHLLHEITRATGARQDLASIFRVVIRTLEDQMPIDFVCICLYDDAERRLTVSNVGIKSAALAQALAIAERAVVEIDENGLSRCVKGELVYEPDISEVSYPFPQRLARGGLGSVVAAPLMADRIVFGVLVTARKDRAGFSSTDCEFLGQLSEHVALSAQQAQLYAALQKAYEDLRRTQSSVMQQERLRALGQMASGIAHDINNAISPLSVYTQSLLETERDLSPRLRSFLETVRRVVNDIGATVARMREFYRERDSNQPHEAANANELVSEVVDFTRARWSDMPQQRGAVITTRIEEASNLPPLSCVKSEIREALTNLVFNAVDAMPAGGVLTIRTSAIEEPNNSAAPRVQIEVEDTGAGMDEGTRRRCLEPFFTTKGERGTGLGLAMVYGAVQRHNAELEIDSAPGEGTCVRIIFPPSAVMPASRNEDAPRTPSRALRILLVDDDPFVLDSMRFVLDLDGHSVAAASGGQEGLDLFHRAMVDSSPFDVVITDLGMPYIDGNRVARDVKTASLKTPVILLSGWGRRMNQDEEVHPNIDCTLGKPADLVELRGALARLCDA